MPARGWRRDAPGSTAGRKISRHCATHPGFGDSALPDWVGHGGRSRLSLSRSGGGAGAARRDAGRRLLRRLDRRRDGGARHTAFRAAWCWSIPLGIKVSGVTDRDIADMHAMTRTEFMRRAWADPARGAVDYDRLPETELAAIARGREVAAGVRLEAVHAQSAAEALAASDRSADPAAVGRAGRDRYPRLWPALAGTCPGSRLEVIPDAGHYPHWEQPEAFVRHLVAFGAM